MKTLLFSITSHDCIRQTFRCGGCGGQRLNSTDTGVRFIHEPSGAVGWSCDGRKQSDNARLAWKRMAQSDKMQSWLRLEAARRNGTKSVDQMVDEAMEPKFLRVETFENGKWMKEKA